MYIYLHSGSIYIGQFFKKQYNGFEAESLLVRALRVLIDFNGPDHPLLKPVPTSKPEPYFISCKGQQSWLIYSVVYGKCRCACLCFLNLTWTCIVALLSVLS